MDGESGESVESKVAGQVMPFHFARYLDVLAAFSLFLSGFIPGLTPSLSDEFIEQAG